VNVEMNVTLHNSKAWDKKVENNVTYTQPVQPEVINKAKRGDWEIGLTTYKAVPRDWFPASLTGLKVLCLASGGGQQGPILAAAGADVTVVDISEKQLARDREVAEREGLSITTIKGDMTNLHFLADETFDLIVHPVSNVFVEDVNPVWKEAARVLKDKGTLLAGFANPVLYLLNHDKEEDGILEVANAIPYSSYSSLSAEQLKRFEENNIALEFGHSLEDLIQGQLNAGFVVSGFYEDNFAGKRLVDNYINTFIATKAIKIKL
jgi:ubiquinone/menaquinone biosynthesis C-methylase UbiE